MPRKNQADWSVQLTRLLTRKDGTKIVTLADARAAVLPAVALAIERLLTAAETGSFTDREAATDQVEIMLGWPQRVEPSGRKALGGSNDGDDIGSASEKRRCDEAVAELMTDLEADLQEAVAAMRGVDGQRRHRWPAFLLAQAHLGPSLPQTERPKGFAEVVRQAEATNSKHDPLLDLARSLPPDEDAFAWSALGGVNAHAQAA
jgi:hypothetical protein